MFACLVGTRTTWLHAWAVAALAADIGLILFTIDALEHPFDGDLRVGPDAFELVLHTIEGTGKQQS